MELTPAEIARGSGAELVAGDSQRAGAHDAPTRAVVDSRAAGPGELFVGLPGEHTDGGRFAGQALEAGAWGALLSGEHAHRVAAAAGGARVFAAEDPLTSLGRLARTWLDRLGQGGCRVVGISGSTGKTSTKDILLALLAPVLKGRVHASPENYNTEIGLPLAVLEAGPGTQVLVLEVAMRGPGQIRALCEIARPTVGVITNVGPVHLELVGTVEAVAAAKAELIEALPPDGVCVLPAAEETLRSHLPREVRTLTFAGWPPGQDGIADAGADIRALSARHLNGESGTPGMRAEIAVGPERAVLEFNFRQAHNLANALAAVGAAHALGVPLDALREGAGQVRFSSLRGEEVELGEGVLLINDCYNANPMSVRAALDDLAAVAARRESRSVAVLGEMAELGPGAREFHRELGEHAARSGVGLLVAVGELASAYADGFAEAGETHTAADAPEASETLGGLVEPGDVVLVKGSRSVGLELVAETLAQGVKGAPGGARR